MLVLLASVLMPTPALAAGTGTIAGTVELPAGSIAPGETVALIIELEVAGEAQGTQWLSVATPPLDGSLSFAFEIEAPADTDLDISVKVQAGASFSAAYVSGFGRDWTSSWSVTIAGPQVGEGASADVGQVTPTRDGVVRGAFEFSTPPTSQFVPALYRRGPDGWSLVRVVNDVDGDGWARATDRSYAYSFTNLPFGEYTIDFVPEAESKGACPAFWNAAGGIEDATSIVVSELQPVASGIGGSGATPPCVEVTGTGGVGALGTASQVLGGIRLTGWWVDLSTAASGYIWVTIDGRGTMAAASQSLPWFPILYPGYGTRHGFDVTVPTAAGTHRVCVYGSLGPLIECRQVTVRAGDGAIGSIAQVMGGLRLTGWSVDLSTSTPGYLWITIDGRGHVAAANRRLEWFPALYPGYGTDHGFDVVLPIAPGSHQVCVYEAASALSLGCRQIEIIAGVGALGAVTPQLGGVRLTGWWVDLSTANAGYLWVTVDGIGRLAAADQSLAWFPALYPGYGTNHGFDVTVPATPGPHQVCVYGSLGPLIECRQVTVQSYEAGAFGTLTASGGSVRATGWAIDLRTPTQPAYVWVTVDGVSVGPRAANSALSWFPALYLGAGTGHGFDFTLNLPAGAHTVCLYGAATGVGYGCRSVYVIPANPGNSVNCADFGNWWSAQSWFDYYRQWYGDVAGLDGDNDGIACEALPGAP